ncbi:MAG: helix-turn-helix domain-containing protein [Methylophilus sp.]|uniref:AraC-like ligand-binding domain-containing protein n=1 Tax=Methylophilus sp. TaxID=29541 RepID=UPI003F9F5E9E
MTMQVVADIGRRFSTEDIQPWHRKAWLREVIGREYADVEIIPPATAPLFNEMTLYPWQDLQLSVIHSNSITIERGAREISHPELDNYFAVLLLKGRYVLQQQGREVFLKPGDMTLYDATRPHRIHCPEAFSKLIVAIPRALLHRQLPVAGHYTAMRLHGEQGMGAMLSPLIQNLSQQLHQLSTQSFNASAHSVVELLGLTLRELVEPDLHLSHSRALSLLKVKQWVASHLQDGELNSEMVAAANGLSSRYINQLFAEEHTALMRYVWQQRLAHSAQLLTRSNWQHRSVSEIALASGFNDFSHFSRVFKQRFGQSPRAYRQQSARQDSVVITT